MNRTTLVIIFNHRFDRNIPILKELYGSRFDRVVFLVPFYDGDDPDVIPVIYGSHEFGGFVFNALNQLSGDGSDHYVFAGDDLILHPHFDRDMNQVLGIKSGVGYIKRLVPMTRLPYTWAHTLAAMESLHNGAFNWREFLPSQEEALARFREHGFEYPKFSWSNVKPVRIPRDFQEIKRWLRRGWLHMKFPERRMPEFPFLESYADFFIVPASALQEFATLNGYFAALKIHAELAIPTALALSCKDVVVEAASSYVGIELWRPWERISVEEKYGKNLNRLLEEFPDKTLYIHPVKLSGWDVTRSF